MPLPPLDTWYDKCRCGHERVQHVFFAEGCDYQRRACQCDQFVQDTPATPAAPVPGHKPTCICVTCEDSRATPPATQCRCPFPRDKCPHCAHPRGACEAASLATPPAVPDAPDATPSRPIGTLWLGPGGYVFVPTGGRPGIGVSGRDSVDTLCDIEQSTRGEPIAALPAEPEAPRCEGWCGGRYEEAHRTMPGKTVFFARWCSNACRTAGRALRPSKEGTP